MRRHSKLLHRILLGASDANVRFSEVGALLRELGFKERIHGSHHKIRYEVIIYWSDEDEAFIAEVPDLPGCVADGPTCREALTNVEVVIREWIDTAIELGRPIPQPKGRLVFA